MGLGFVEGRESPRLLVVVAGGSEEANEGLARADKLGCWMRLLVGLGLLVEVGKGKNGEDEEARVFGRGRERERGVGYSVN